MSKILVIAEKPSVAGDLAKALGKFKKEKGFYEGDEMVISHTVGHLLEIQEPDSFKVVRGKWSLENLPVLGFLVIQDGIRIDRLIELTRMSVNAHLAEHAFHTKRA